MRASEALYNGAANATKSPGHELKSQNAVCNLHPPGLHLPLFVCIDYRGFRISAMSLLPIASHTLKYAVGFFVFVPLPAAFRSLNSLFVPKFAFFSLLKIWVSRWRRDFYYCGSPIK